MTSKKIVFLSAFKIVFLLWIFFLGTDQVSGQDKKKKKSVTLEAEAGFATIYDDNILKYSEKYIERFLNREDNGRFHITTYDDLILKPSLKLSATYRFINNLNTKFNADFSHNKYLENNIKDGSTISFGIQQFLTKKASLRISYTYIPDFYVRHFRDADWTEVFGYIPETFQPYSFAKDNYGFWVQNTFLKDTRVRLILNYSKYYHNEHFTEYDCDNYQYGLRLYQPVHKKVKIEAGYQFITSDAKAYDEPGETKETSDDSDATSEEDGFYLGISWKLPGILKLDHDISVAGEYEIRYYTTDNYIELDEEHAGRIDKNFDLQFAYDIKVNKSLNLSAFYEWMGRNSSSKAEANREYLSLEKDYRQNKLGIEITYKLKY